jgi:hypothetical protein
VYDGKENTLRKAFDNGSLFAGRSAMEAKEQFSDGGYKINQLIAYCASQVNG